MRTRVFSWVALGSTLLVGAGCVEPVVPPGDLDTDGYASIRVVAAATDSPPLDVWVDGQRVMGAVEPGEVRPEAPGEYLMVRSGVREVSFVPFGGTKFDAVYAAPFALQRDAHYTVYTYGSLAAGPYLPFGAEVTYDDRPCAEGVSCAKVMHTARGLGAVDIWLFLSPEEGWVRTDKFLSQGETTWRPLDLEQGRVCGVGFARAGARAPEFAFPYKAPAGENQLFLVDSGESWFLNHHYPDRAKAVVLDDLHRLLMPKGELARIGNRTRVPNLSELGFDKVGANLQTVLPLPDVEYEPEVPFWDDRRFHESPIPLLVGAEVEGEELALPVWPFEDRLGKKQLLLPDEPDVDLPRYRMMVVGPAGVEVMRPMALGPFPVFPRGEGPDVGNPVNPEGYPWWPEPFDPSYPQ